MKGPGTTAARTVALLAAALVLGTGCGAVENGGPGQAPLGSGCLPPPFSLDAATAVRGGTVTARAEDADCDPRYGAAAQVEVVVTDAAGVEVLRTLAPMADKGGFSVALHIPETTAPGQAAVTAFPHELDWCDDTGRNNRISHGAGPGPEIRRTSCVLPVQPLQIVP